jgi:hypothetical protein
MLSMANLLQGVFQATLCMGFTVVQSDAGFLDLADGMAEPSKVWCVSGLGRELSNAVQRMISDWLLMEVSIDSQV